MDVFNETAREVFGLSYLFPYQRLVISNILRRAGYFSPEEAAEAPARQVVLLPTGAGKSLCFMLPAKLLPGLTVVVFPLLGLMADQLRRVSEAGMAGALLKGGMSRAEKAALWDKLRVGKLRMLLTNPEMLALEEVRKELGALRISHLVIDEAHTVPEWGETFRPACLELGRSFDRLGPEQITAFTATASPDILAKIRNLLMEGRPFNLVRGNPDRINIRYEVHPVLSRMQGLETLLRRAERPVLVFCATRKQCEKTALALSRRLKEPEVRFYHAGLSPSLRTRREQWFFRSDRGILTATCAYGMGMDKGNIRTVVHMALPASAEAYLQESGRAGRDRRPCRAVLLYHPDDRRREERNPRPDLRERYEKLLAFAEESRRCRRESLLAVLEARPEDCDSCDVCRGEARSRDPAEEVLLRLLRAYPRRFSPALLRDFLLGRHSRELRRGGYHRSPGFALCRGWPPEDVEEALRGLLSRSRARLLTRGGWKGRLTATASKGLLR